MNNTILSAKDNILLEKLIVKHGKVVTSSQIQAEARPLWDYQQTKNRISKLVENGWLVRIKRGLYAISELSTLGFLSISPFVVANLLVEDSYVSFESALAHRGMFDQFTSHYVAVSLRQYKTTNLESIQYRFVKTKESMFVGWEAVEIDNLTAKIATAEKALVDMIHFRTGKYFVDLAIEKIQNYHDDLDTPKLVHYASLASLKTTKTLGLIFDLLGFNSEQFHQSMGNKITTHRMSKGDKTFNAKWRLYYDEYFDKYHKAKGA